MGELGVEEVLRRGLTGRGVRAPLAGAVLLVLWDRRRTLFEQELKQRFQFKRVVADRGTLGEDTLEALEQAASTPSPASGYAS